MGYFAGLIPFIQFKKREKHTERSDDTFTKIITPQWVFFTFITLHKWYQIMQSVSHEYRVCHIPS